MANIEDKYPSFIPSASKKKPMAKPLLESRRQRPLTQSETKAEINRSKLYEGNSFFLHELCSLPVTWRASNALSNIKEGKSMFGCLGAMAATAGELTAKVCAMPVMMATSVVAAASPSTVDMVDATAAVMLEGVKNAVPIVRSDPIKTARWLKYKSMKTFYEGAKSLVKSNVGQFTLKTVNQVVNGTELLLDMVDSPVAEQEEPQRLDGEIEEEGPPSDDVPGKDVGIVRKMLALPLKAMLMVTKPVQKTMDYFGRNRRLRSKSAPTPRVLKRGGEKGTRKSLEGRRKVSPRKRVPAIEISPFYYRYGHAVLVALRLAKAEQDEARSIPAPVYKFDPSSAGHGEENGIRSKRKHDEVESEDSGDGTLSDIMGDMEGYCSEEDPSYEYDDGCADGYSDSFEYMTDSFSEIEEELEFVEEEAKSNIIGGRVRQQAMKSGEVDLHAPKNADSKTKVTPDKTPTLDTTEKEASKVVPKEADSKVTPEKTSAKKGKKKKATTVGTDDKSDEAGKKGTKESQATDDKQENNAMTNDFDTVDSTATIVTKNA